jgi:hypothetical protein
MCGAANTRPDWSEVLETRKVVLCEKGGDARAVLEIAGGQPRLTFYGKDAKQEMISMSIDDHHGPIITLFDADGTQRLVMHTGLGPEIDFCDEKGIASVSVGYYGRGYGAVIMRDSNTNTRLFLSTTSSGESSFILTDNGRTDRVALGVSEKGETRFQVTDSKGAPLLPGAGGK